METNKAPDQGRHGDKFYEPLQSVSHFLKDLIQALSIMGNQSDDVTRLDPREIFEP